MKNLLSKNGIDFNKPPTILFTCKKEGCNVLFESDEYRVEGEEGWETPVDTCPICGSIVKEKLQSDLDSL
ncbi:MAG: hypothetical protein M0R17_01850 [Candidatus Omnitrophica bacterium]|jgi:rRNA maturation endonuclease Nob1|nr:hypothetical protein [Candidatus Omnitrophota bacterium]